MPPVELLDRSKRGTATLSVHSDSKSLGEAAALLASRVLQDAIRVRGYARLIVATGNSQIPLAEELVKQPVNWSAVDLFQMDEYVNLPPDHPSSFRNWIRKRLAERVHPRQIFYLDGDPKNLDAKIKHHTDMLLAEPIDLAFVGFGENGHIAFNDPHVADFNDSSTVKRVVLDAACRRQQAGEGHFPDENSVPKEALTITCPGLFRADAWVCCVPELRKAEAVRNALEGPISESCPASLVRRHPNASIFLDVESASLLSAELLTRKI